jgi:hypothetical protein
MFADSFASAAFLESAKDVLPFLACEVSNGRQLEQPDVTTLAATDIFLRGVAADLVLRDKGDVGWTKTWQSQSSNGLERWKMSPVGDDDDDDDGSIQAILSTVSEKWLS